MRPCLSSRHILAYWCDASEPEWLIGKLSAKGEYDLEGFKGNYQVTYADGTKAVHMLAMYNYAESVEGADEHAWVLLGEPPPPPVVLPPPSAAPPPAPPEPPLALPAPTSVNVATPLGPPLPPSRKAKMPPAVGSSSTGASSSRRTSGPNSRSTAAPSSRSTATPSSNGAAGPSSSGTSARLAEGRRTAAAALPMATVQMATVPDLSGMSSEQLAQMQVYIAQLMQNASP